VAICSHNCARSASSATWGLTLCSRSRIRIRARPADRRFRNHCGVLLEPPMPFPTTRYPPLCSKVDIRHRVQCPATATGHGQQQQRPLVHAPAPDTAAGAPIQPHVRLRCGLHGFPCCKVHRSPSRPHHASHDNLHRRVIGARGSNMGTVDRRHVLQPSRRSRCQDARVGPFRRDQNVAQYCSKPAAGHPRDFQITRAGRTS
jgi:hypothetical protein